MSLATRLRRQIVNGELKPGEQLPSEKKLMDSQGLSRGTVRRALEELIGEGLIVSENGRGYKVVTINRLVFDASAPERNTDTVNVPAGAWADEVRAQGRTPSMTISVGIEYADERTARWLEIGEGDPVTVRKRLRLVDGEPYSIADSYYPRSIVGGTAIEEPGDVKPGVYAIFADIGHPWASTVDRWFPRPPTREETNILHIPRGVAVAEIVRRTFDVAGKPVRLAIFIMPGDRHEIEYRHGNGAHP